MSGPKSHVPSRAPPAGSVASGHSCRTGVSRPPDDGPNTERRKSVSNYKAPTVVPADSISQAGDEPEHVSIRSGSRSVRASQVGGSHAGSQRLTAEALEALSERNSNAGSSRTVRTHRVEVIEEASSPPQPTCSRVASQAQRSSYSKGPSVKAETMRSSHDSRDRTAAPSKVVSKAASRATTRPATAAPSRAASKAVSRATTRRTAAAASGSASSYSDSSESEDRPRSQAASRAARSKATSAAPSYHASRRSSLHAVEIAEQAEAEAPRAKSVAPSRHSSKRASEADGYAAGALAVSRLVAPSHARSKAASRAPSKAQTAASSHHAEIEAARSQASHAPSRHSTAKPAKSVASRAPSHATSHHSASTSPKSATSHATSHRSSHCDPSTAPTSPASPTAPQPPPTFEEKATSSSEHQIEENMQLVKRSSYDVVAPRDTRVDVVELRRRDGKLLEREYAISPSRYRSWQPSVSVGVADGSVYRKQYRYRRPQRIAYMRRLSSYDGY